LRILNDTGPLVAMINPRESRHQECVDIWRESGLEYTTTLACITETFYLLGEAMGFYGQKKLLALLESEALSIFEINTSHFRRIGELMTKYGDVPMDFADASLVVTAEDLGTNRIFTLDSDFTVYRINRRKSFEIIPELIP